MNHAFHRGRKHLNHGLDGQASPTAGLRNNRSVTLQVLGFERAMRGAPGTARHLVQQHPVKGGMKTMDRNHAVNKIINQLVQRRALPDLSQHPQHVVQVMAPDGIYQHQLVGEILVNGPDADAGDLGNLVRREASPAPVGQNASPGSNDDLHHSPGTRLARLFAHR